MPRPTRQRGQAVTIGLDMGGTSVKAVAVDDTGRLRAFLKEETETAGDNAVASIARRLAGEFALDWSRVRCISVTGIGDAKPKGKSKVEGVPILHTSEFTAMGRGAMALSGLERGIVASMGTGTAIVRFGPGEAVHLGGTGMGGGVISGLCRHFYGLQRFPDIMALAEKGRLDQVDFRIGDLARGRYAGLSPELTLANFGKITARATREDVILGLVNMVLETVGVISIMACRTHNLDTVVLCGALTLLPQLRSVFDRFAGYSGISFVVPENASYAMAYGAALEGEAAMPQKRKAQTAARAAAPASVVAEVIRECEACRDPEQAKQSMRFFKTGVGEYGEGDRFLGLKAPAVKGIIKSFWKRLSLEDCESLLDSEWHEVRTVALLSLTAQAESLAKKGDKEGLEQLLQVYDRKLDRANNWDLVDLSVYKIMGAYWQTLKTPQRRIREQLSAWAESGALWRERAAMVATYARIRAGSLKETFWLSERFIDHPHDLMHKASGWMLREAGKRDIEALRRFLKRFHRKLPRTALRYAIERMDAEERKEWMQRG